MTIQDVSVNEKLHVWGLEFVDTTTLVSTSSDGCVQVSLTAVKYQELRSVDAIVFFPWFFFFLNVSNGFIWR